LNQNTGTVINMRVKIRSEALNYENIRALNVVGIGEGYVIVEGAKFSPEIEAAIISTAGEHNTSHYARASIDAPVRLKHERRG